MGKDASGISYRIDQVDLTSSLEGNFLLDKRIIMEIKVLNALPIWLVKGLSKQKIYKGSISKYSTVFRQNKEKKLKGEINYGRILQQDLLNIRFKCRTYFLNTSCSIVSGLVFSYLFHYYLKY